MMLRSIRPAPTSRVEQLCREGDWENLLLELLKNDEANQNCTKNLLSSALRCHSHQRVPLNVVRVLYEADPTQILLSFRNTITATATYGTTTTLLHETIQYQASEDVVQFVLHKTQRDCPREALCSSDYLGRTPLHCLVLRWQQQIMRRYTTVNEQQPHASTTAVPGQDSTFSMITIEMLLSQVIDACPEACAHPDSDGTTPLIQLFQTALHDGDVQQQQQQQQQVESVIRHMLKVCPKAGVTAAERPVSRGAVPWRFAHFQYKHDGSSPSSSSSPTRLHTPLYYALLHGRSADTIQRLVQIMMEERKHHRSCSLGDDCPEDREAYSTTAPFVEIVTPYHETYLHVAVTVQAPADVLAVLVQFESTAVQACDCYNLTPIDWLWIGHVRNVRQQYHPQQPSQQQFLSRRRHLANDHLDWHERVSASSLANAMHPTRAADRASTIATLSRRHLSSQDTHNGVTSYRPTSTQIEALWQALLSRMKVLMPAAAASRYGSNASSWNLLDATCAVSSPSAMVELALSHSRRRQQQELAPEDQEHTSVISRTAASHAMSSICDSAMSRTALHYAVAVAGSYTTVLPMGVSRGIKLLSEPRSLVVQKVVSLEACGISDCAGQLPLHVAIDAFQELRRATASTDSVLLVSQRKLDANTLEETDEDKILDHLLAHNPSALEQRDGETKLFPWMQAAVGENASLNTVYSVFRRCPSTLNLRLANCD